VAFICDQWCDFLNLKSSFISFTDLNSRLAVANVPVPFSEVSLNQFFTGQTVCSLSCLFSHEIFQLLSRSTGNGLLLAVSPTIKAESTLLVKDREHDPSALITVSISALLVHDATKRLKNMTIKIIEVFIVFVFKG
jgi:hypothetical protein